MCGGTQTGGWSGSEPQGLSPRVRGNPGTGTGTGTRPRVYPRVCGGTYHYSPTPAVCKGLSPRVRGNQLAPVSKYVRYGSIPACAGEPLADAASEPILTVYPRVCGGTGEPALEGTRNAGLSPRVRGNQALCDTPPSVIGSIPACAGEPERNAAWMTASQVYPRVCGGTPIFGLLVGRRRGLSPRVRGNPRTTDKSRAGERSIPACAGEPALVGRRICPPAVYPRVCGGTGGRYDYRYGGRGLSPRVRGNRRRPRQRNGQVRSIPACAGEPRRSLECVLISLVYPRVCGGTSLWSESTPVHGGLSPRVRGNLSPSPARVKPAWSIPACAGEPPAGHFLLWGVQVYPRVCGGTPHLRVGGRPQDGLSPRVRGNPERATLPS